MPRRRATNIRTMVLRTAETLVNGDRNAVYGPPTEDFDRTARLWTAYLDGRSTVQAHDVAALMILLKMSRISWQPDHDDSWIDIAGYAACGLECVEHEEADGE